MFETLSRLIIIVHKQIQDGVIQSQVSRSWQSIRFMVVLKSSKFTTLVCTYDTEMDFQEIGKT